LLVAGDEGASLGHVDYKLDDVVISDASGIILMTNKVCSAVSVAPGTQT
jgi:hypothetical protein